MSIEMVRNEDQSPVVILPPLGVTASGLAEMVWALSDERAVMSYEFPGHGLTPAAEAITIAGLGEGVVRTLDRDEVSNVSLCGCGFGGMVALWLAANHPDRIAQLCVICSSAIPGNVTGYRSRAVDVRDGGLSALVPGIVTAWVTPARAAADPPLMRRLQAMLESADPVSYAACCDAVAGLDLSEGLRLIEAPTLVLAASEDRGLPPQHSRLLADTIADADYGEVAGAAHLPWLEQPAAVFEAIRRHLRGSRVHSY